MRRFKITGGPAPVDVKVVDSESGVDITNVVLGFELVANPSKLMLVKFTTFAEVDLEAVDEDVDA
jgi:hypothetical protein